MKEGRPEVTPARTAGPSPAGLLVEHPALPLPSRERDRVTPAPAGKVVLQMGSSRSNPGEGAIPSERLIASAGPPSIDDVSLGIWMPNESKKPQTVESTTAATEDRLRALGYLD